MKSILPICILLLIISCTPDSSTELKIREYEGSVCGNCPKVRISIPEAEDNTKLGKSVNRAVREEIIELLDFAEDKTVVDIPGAIEAFTMGFRNLQNEFPEELTGWEASVTGTKSYEDPSLLTLHMETYIFTGGAHGYGATRYLNFDKKTGAELSGTELLNDPEAFSEFAEKAFRKTYDIPEEAPINSTGFMFAENRFTLPENIGLAAEGIVLHYNPYEVASYADGALILKIPMEQGLPFLNKPDY
ncbi:MAG: DUF3298 domain-containing protein [Robiginitalea sp.]|uniref:DUF3298 and DUF4163 domain-containing protein n=1 Tax=Robiginitalea sp. TaxID=1902411 RepID=UPI003C7877A9